MNELTIGQMKRSSVYLLEAHDKDGNLLWSEEVHNLVTTVGLNDSLDKQFKASGYTAAWYVGITDGTPTFAAGDTAASHAGWTEVEDYSEANRQELTLGSVAAGSVNNSASKAVFTIDDDSIVIGGAFVVSVSTKGGSTGVVYGGAALSADRTLNTSDTLTITVTLSAASA